MPQLREGLDLCQGPQLVIAHSAELTIITKHQA